MMSAISRSASVADGGHPRLGMVVVAETFLDLLGEALAGMRTSKQ